MQVGSHKEKPRYRKENYALELPNFVTDTIYFKRIYLVIRTLSYLYSYKMCQKYLLDWKDSSSGCCNFIFSRHTTTKCNTVFEYICGWFCSPFSTLYSF